MQAPGRRSAAKRLRPAPVYASHAYPNFLFAPAGSPLKTILRCWALPTLVSPCYMNVALSTIIQRTAVPFHRGLPVPPWAQVTSDGF